MSYIVSWVLHYSNLPVWLRQLKEWCRNCHCHKTLKCDTCISERKILFDYAFKFQEKLFSIKIQHTFQVTKRQLCLHPESLRIHLCSLLHHQPNSNQDMLSLLSVNQVDIAEIESNLLGLVMSNRKVQSIETGLNLLDK